MHIDAFTHVRPGRPISAAICLTRWSDGEQVIPRRGRRRKKNADSDSDNESVASSARGGGGRPSAAEQDLKGFHHYISEESEDSESNRGGADAANYESIYATLSRQPGRQLEEEVHPEAEFERRLEESKDRMDEFLQKVALFEVLTDRRDRDIMANEMRVRILVDGEELIKAGDRMSDHFFVLFRGQLVRTVGGSGGDEDREEEAMVLQPGCSVGEEALLSEVPQPATIAAKGLCVVLEFAVDQLFFIRKKILVVQEAEKLGAHVRPVPPKMGQLKSALSFRVDYKAKASRSKVKFRPVRAVAHHTSHRARLIGFCAAKSPTMAMPLGSGNYMRCPAF